VVILIVDDSKLNLNIAQDILIKNYIQCKILLADSGEECLKILESTHVDIVILDIVMPGLSGLDVLEKIKNDKNYRNINVIMLTSLTNRDVLKHCFEYGANDFINKPIETTEFIARIKA
jgi:CheY-like chemotaxis protein